MLPMEQFQLMVIQGLDTSSRMLWASAVRQTMLVSALDLAASLTVGLVLAVTAKSCWARQKEEWDLNERPAVGFALWLVAAVIVALFWLLNGSDTVAGVINPEYGALKRLSECLIRH